MKTSLSLAQLPLTFCEEFALIDLSVYNPDIPVENAYLEVLVPDLPAPVRLNYTVSGVTVLTTQNLKLSEGCTEIPSGLYVIVQTIKPNDRLRETHYVFNTIPERKMLACLVSEYIRECKDLDMLFEIHASLDIVERLAKEAYCAEANKLFNTASNKLHSLCVACV